MPEEFKDYYEPNDDIGTCETCKRIQDTEDGKFPCNKCKRGPQYGG